MKKITLLTAFMLFIFTVGFGQTVLISPGDGSFSTGNTFAANGWTVSNSSNNPWYVGNIAATGVMAGNGAYVSNTGGTTHNYDNTLTATNYFYRDITVPAGQTKINLSFNWIGNGEASWDMWQVFVAPTSIIPVGVPTHPGSGTTNVPAGIAGATFIGFGQTQTTVQSATFQLPATLAGTTFRLIFSFKSDGSGGNQPPSAIDNIALTSEAGGNFISITSGNWSSPSTWNLNAVPANNDASVTVATGHAVTIDATGATITPALTVNGTLNYSTAATSLTVLGGLTVNSGGVVNVLNATTGKSILVSGNLVNNGAIDLSVGTTTAGSLTLNGTAVQTVSGTGTYNNNIIRNLLFTNTSTAIPNINWQVNNISVDYNLTITNAKVNLGTNKLTFGTSATSAGSTLAATGGGFMPGGKFARWYTAAGTGFTTTGNTSIPTSVAGRYPFYTPEGLQRVFLLGRTTPTAGGVYAVTYNNVPGITGGLSIVDGTYTVTDRLNSNFVVTTEGTAPAEASTFVTIFAQDAYAPVNGNSRIIKQSAAMSGTHVATGGVAGAQRSGVLQADLLSPTGIFIGANAVDIAFAPIASGNWNNPAIWNKGVVPSCTDLIVINNFTVTVNSAGNVAKGITVGASGTLLIASGDLVVGCTLFNNTLTNNGTLTVNGGTLTVNGNILANGGSIFNQTGGNINVDGNDTGVTANSVASGTAIVQLNSQLINWTGGTFTIIDPHANSSSNTLAYNGGAHIDVVSGHTMRLGDGVSTNAGGTDTYGFRLNTWVGSYRISFFNLVVNGGSGVNRLASTTYGFGINGDLTITANSQFRDNGTSVFIGGNLINNGKYVAASILGMGKYLSGATAPSTVAQTISGTGLFENSITPANINAHVNSLTINNTSTAGVTLSVPLSVSSTLTLTAGKLNTTNTNLLTVGTTTAAGTISGGGTTAYVSGPLARTIAGGNTNTSYVAFPVGKAAYAPVNVAPLTTTVVVMKAEAFDTNTGTNDASLLDLATTRRWEVPVTAGTVTNLNVRLGDANLTAVNIPVQAPAAAGVYTNTFGSVATFAAGTPNTVTANAPLPIASYTGFLSYAKSNSCLGVPAPGNTIASANNICLGNSVNLSVQNSTSGSGVTYQWQSSVNGTTYTNITGATGLTYTATPTVATYYRLNVTCSAGPDTGSSTPVQINFASSVTSATNAARCGAGSITLSAVPSTGANIKWFADATTTVPLASGASFTTNITQNTVFYAGAQTNAPGTVVVGNPASTTTTASNVNTPFTSNWEGARIQYLVRASDLGAAGLSAGPLTSLGFNVTTVGTTTSIQTDYTIKIFTTTATATVGGTYLTGNQTVVYGPVAQAPPTLGLNTLNFSTPFAWDGTSNIVVEICHNNDPTGAGSFFGGNATVRATETTYNSVTGRYADNTALCDNDLGTAITTLTTRPNLTFGGITGCNSARVAVNATVTPPPAFTLSATERAICSGATTSVVTIATGAADYNTYVFTPNTGVSGSAAAGWTFNPAVTTVYSVQASNATCNAVPVTLTVNVTSVPTVITLADATYCEGSSSVALTPFGGTNNDVILSENFNAATNSWTTVNNSVGGTVANSAWTLRADGYVYTADTFHSNDNSQFYLSNSAAQGGTGTETILTSPAFSTVNFEGGSVSFYHHLKETVSGSSRAAIEFSFNGTDWVESNAYEATTGTAGAFALGTAVMPPTMMNKPTVYVRFKFTGVARFFWAIDNVTVRGDKNPGYTWSPATGLYTNAAATTPYVAGTQTRTVYAKPTATTTYTITATNTTGCVTTGSATISLSSTPAPVAAPNLNICTAGTVADLTANATGTGIKWYTTATGNTSLFVTTALVNGTTYYGSQTIGNCESVLRTAVTVTITTISTPTLPQPTQTFCNFGTVADLVATGTEIKWYAAATGGTALAADTALINGTTYYASQSLNACESVGRAALTVTVTVNGAPVLDEPSQTFCNAGTIADLTATGSGVKWYAAETGGVPLDAATALESTTYYASQTIDGCEGLARAAKTVVVNVTATPTGNALQEFCTPGTLAQLTVTGTAIQWYADETGVTPLATDTALVSGTTYYASQTTGTCESLSRFAVDVFVYNVVVEAPADVTECNEYILPVLENGGYFTQPNGAGTEVTAGTTVNETTTFYVYSQEGIDIVCSAQDSFTVTIVGVPAPTGESTQTIQGGVASDVTIEDIEFVQILDGIITWYASQEDAQAGVNPLPVTTQLEAGVTYYATQTIGTCTSATTLAVTITDIVLGKENFDIKAFTYHPNPVTDILNISYSSEITSVTVFNLLGQLVISTQPNANEVKIDMSTLADAPYVINVTAGNTVKTIKVIKRQ